MDKDKIRALREAYSLTQEQIVYLLKVSTATWSRWENGRSVPTGPSLTRLKMLKAALGLGDPAKVVQGLTICGGDDMKVTTYLSRLYEDSQAPGKITA